MDLRKWDVGVWTGLIWLRIGTSGGLLWMRQGTFGFQVAYCSYFLTIWEPVSFGRMSLLHVVSCYSVQQERVPDTILRFMNIIVLAAICVVVSSDVFVGRPSVTCAKTQRPLVGVGPWIGIEASVSTASVEIRKEWANIGEELSRIILWAEGVYSFRRRRNFARSDFMSVLRSAWNDLAATGQIFMKFDIGVFIEICRKFKFH